MKKRARPRRVYSVYIILVRMLGYFQGEDTNCGWQLPLGSGNEGLGWKGFELSLYNYSAGCIIDARVVRILKFSNYLFCPQINAGGEVQSPQICFY